MAQNKLSPLDTCCCFRWISQEELALGIQQTEHVELGRGPRAALLATESAELGELLLVGGSCLCLLPPQPPAPPHPGTGTGLPEQSALTLLLRLLPHHPRGGGRQGLVHNRHHPNGKTHTHK